MLRNKFWIDLKSQQLRNYTRYLYDSHKDFQSLLREIRKVEQDDSCSTPTKQKNRKLPDNMLAKCQQSDNTANIQKQMSGLMSIVKSLEKKIESQQQALAAQITRLFPTNV